MAARSRQSFLTYEPISFSLTDGTNIPPPQESPPPTANETETAQQETAKTNGVAELAKVNGHAGHLQDPTSPAAINKQASPRPQSVRRLFSLGSLRSSFSSSRASLALPRENESSSYDPNARPHSPSASFVTASSTYAPATATPKRPVSRASKKSGSWFKRKSGFWSAENGLASIGEDGPDSKRLRERSPAPALPEIKELAGGDLQDGEVDWDDKLFKKEAV